MTTVLTAMGHYHPEQILENEFFDTLGIDSDSKWIFERTGIKERHSVLSKQQILDIKTKKINLLQLRERQLVMPITAIAEKSWQFLKSRYDGEINCDTIICGTSIPDYDIPAHACAIAARIGQECSAFDANSACSSFIINLHLAKSLISSQVSKKIGIFIPERYTLKTDYCDRSTCVLFGDGSACALVEQSSNKGGLELIDTVIFSAPSKHDLIQIHLDNCFWQNGQAVQKFAITRTIECTKELLRRNNLDISDISYFIGHQANYRMLEFATNKLGFSSHHHLYNVDYYGNQGAAGAPAVLSMNWDKFKSGEYIVITVVGSGLTWGSALLKKC